MREDVPLPADEGITGRRFTVWEATKTGGKRRDTFFERVGGGLGAADGTNKVYTAG